MFRNFIANGHTYRVSIVANNIVFNLFSGLVSDANRDAALTTLAAKLGTDARTAYRVARAMHLRGFVHAPINAYIGGVAFRRAMDRIGYVAA